jgi:hypothetical protein
MSDTDDAVADNLPATPATPEDEARRRPLSPAAERALAEAAARRAEIDRKTAERPTEINGRGGLEPVRYGDWEIKGIASDF